MFDSQAPIFGENHLPCTRRRMMPGHWRGRQWSIDLQRRKRSDEQWFQEIIDDMMIVNTYFRVSSVKVSAGFYLFLGCYIIYI
jgi:uncharacterized membrane protein YobD (UPF0266 family)